MTQQEAAAAGQSESDVASEAVTRDPALDPGIADFLAFMDQAGRPKVHEGTVESAREGFAALAAVAMVDQGPIPGEVEETRIAGRPARVFRPVDADGARPTVLFLHGGGWVIGDLESHDQPCRRLARDTGAVVVSLDYRLAPEHPFPAAPEDALAAAQEIAADLAEYGGSDRFGVAGDSAGGNLAARLAQVVPEIDAQLLIYPSVDKARDYPSRAENARGYMLEVETMAWFMEKYAPEADPTDPRLSPLHGIRAGLPPAVVVTAGFDPLRDEGIAYAEALARLGVAVELAHHDSLIHGFLDMGKFSAAADEAVADMHARFAALLV